MSIAEIPRQESEFERVPPHDLNAEQCVLGGMMLAQDAISDVVEELRSNDFYRPAHQVIYDVILDLYGRGEPADAVTVGAELTKRGEHTRTGGAPYLFTLINSVPTAANAGYYAKIVQERSVLRRLVEAGTRIVQLGYTAGADADDLLDQAQAEVYAIADKRSGEDYLQLGDIMPGALDEIEAIGSRDGSMVGVPTGFTDLDALTNGLHGGQMIVIAARPAMGKALDLDTPLPTPAGWTTMRAAAPGDLLLGSDGRPVAVTAISEVMEGRPCFEVEFCDGARIVADAEHLWTTLESSGVEAVRTTAEIAASLLASDGSPAHTVALHAPLVLPSAPLPVAPYAFGALVASAAVASPVEGELAMRVEGALAGRPRPGENELAADSGLPSAYLRASAPQRRALLAGILDAAGLSRPDGTITLPALPAALADSVAELLATLAHPCTRRPALPGETGERADIVFVTDEEVFRDSVKERAHKEARREAGPVAGERRIVAVRPVPSRPVKCVQVDAADRLYLAGRRMVATHNSTLALDFVRAASIRHGLTSAFFSLEMGRNEITMRLLSAEARVALHAMRSGTMNDDDWTRLARRMSEVAEAPLFIDDSPNMSMMEIRAKCRRLKQQHDLRLVVIDYLQLMSSGKRVESRQVEVSEFSRSLKLLAKELQVPVIALSQLNRGPEQRTDKRPMVSDLRESGCVTASTRLMRADNNEEVTIGELFASGARDIPVWALDDRLKYVPRTLTHAFSSGHKEVFRVTLSSGRQVEATMNHPFLTYGGWRDLGSLAVGARVAVPRHVPPPLNTARMDDDEIVVLAHLIGDGSFVKSQPIRYASTDEACLGVVEESAVRRFGVRVRRDDHVDARVTTLRLASPHHLTHGSRNPIAEWLDKLGLFGLRSAEKFVPHPVFSLPKDQVALFLRHLWATDGCVWWDDKSDMCRVYYASSSRRLVDDVARLLLRFGIITRVKTSRKEGYEPSYQLHIYAAPNQLAFFEHVGVHGARGEVAREAAPRLRAKRANTNRDTVPVEVWDDVKTILTERDMSHREFARALGTKFCGSTQWKHAPGRQRLTRVAEVLESTELELMATNDVFWDEIASVESIGVQEVFDATVMGLSNFIANGIALHNSIEQDADMVILLHREDAYEKESPRAGEADLIVAKHRNGPTATVTVAFQGHYSRFVDMATG
ncbi:replicative DNA helicase [Actinocorallia herbida]|uniref:Replicative DNA helicase n=1 Tax=Actinocorallia herbida TaxID=58109 RepID=A0A3N1DB54_9ACTN|nr:replicative DNA helicase [Actinocorallia herbida]ROO90751.1 replicative DNA helicase [Actinocorallia herbida]